MHPIEHDLGCPVPSRSDVARHLVLRGSGQAEVQDLQLAVLVDRDVGRLQVLSSRSMRNSHRTCGLWPRYITNVYATYPVYYARGVNVLQATQNLIDEELHVIVRQLLRSDDVVQVSAHQMRNQVPVKG